MSWLGAYKMSMSAIPRCHLLYVTSRGCRGPNEVMARFVGSKHGKCWSTVILCRHAVYVQSMPIHCCPDRLSRVVRYAVVIGIDMRWGASRGLRIDAMPWHFVVCCLSLWRYVGRCKASRDRICRVRARGFCVWIHIDVHHVGCRHMFIIVVVLVAEEEKERQQDKSNREQQAASIWSSNCVFSFQVLSHLFLLVASPETRNKK